MHIWKYMRIYYWPLQRIQFGAKKTIWSCFNRRASYGDVIYRHSICFLPFTLQLEMFFAHFKMAFLCCFPSFSILLPYLIWLWFSDNKVIWFKSAAFWLSDCDVLFFSGKKREQPIIISWEYPLGSVFLVLMPWTWNYARSHCGS